MPPTIDDTSELKKLLEEDIAIGKDNNRLLREMRRNAMLGFVAKIVIWLILLGVPLFILSTYLGPLMDALENQSATGATIPGGLFGIPSEEQINNLIEQYQAVQQ